MKWVYVLEVLGNFEGREREKLSYLFGKFFLEFIFNRVVDYV